MREREIERVGERQRAEINNLNDDHPLEPCYEISQQILEIVESFTITMPSQMDAMQYYSQLFLYNYTKINNP